MKLSRRTFLVGSAVVGGGLVVGLSLRGSGPGPVRAVGGAYTANALLQITPDSTVHFYCPREEMGQGITTGLATLIGEELDVDPARIRIEMALADAAYGNPLFGGVQGTGGSTSLRAHYLQLRQLGADVRQAILNAAAAELDLPADDIDTDDGFVVARGERLPYGTFAARAETQALPEDTPLKAPETFRWIGREFPRIDGMEKATGRTVFGIDVTVPDLHHAVVKRPPVAGGTVASYDGLAAKAMPGVIAVVPVATGVAVVAKRYWQAKQAAEKLSVEWRLPELAAVDSAGIRADYAAALENEVGLRQGERGDVPAALEAAAHRVSADYWAPFLAHAPMEPMNAIVRIAKGEADVWSGCQFMGAMQGLVARYAGLRRDRVRAHRTYLGGAFGRRGTLTHIVEATQAAKATGKPVQVLWSREDDIRNGFYRPASLMRLQAGISAAGEITAWEAKRVGGNITPDTLRQVLPGILPAAVPNGAIGWLADRAGGLLEDWFVEPNAVEGLFEDYDFPNREVSHVTVDHGLPLTFWRSVGHSYTAFAKESMVDELAATAALDEVEVRLANTKDKPRLHEVIRVAGERMRTMAGAPDRALGIAAHESFGTSVAEVAEVSVQDGEIRVHRVLCVVDCGVAVNPDVIRAQMEGAVMFGLTAALHGKLELENGAIQESNFHDYPILRMNEAPAVEVVIIASDAPPSGVGEPGLPPIAPAVANAVYKATGQRLRALPLRLDESVS